MQGFASAVNMTLSNARGQIANIKKQYPDIDTSSFDTFAKKIYNVLENKCKELARVSGPSELAQLTDAYKYFIDDLKEYMNKNLLK